MGSGDGGWNAHTMYVLKGFGDGSRRGSCFILAVSPLLGRNGVRSKGACDIKIYDLGYILPRSHFSVRRCSLFDMGSVVSMSLASYGTWIFVSQALNGS